MAPKSKEKSLRVGFLVTVAAVIFMVGLFFIGSEQKIFARKQEYNVRLDNVTGLAEGNPVKISGVTVGVIRDINLPRDPKKKDVDITLMVDKKFAERIRTDSRARLKKLGLLAGDSYIDISPGSPRFDALPAGSNIPAARQTNVDQLISSGEDLVDNFVQISYSLKNVLNRIDRGEGLLGEITTQPETKQRITDTFLTTLNKTNAILAHVESGHGVLGKLVYDDKYAEELTSSLSQAAKSLQAIAANVQNSFDKGEGMLPALLHDPEGKKKVYELVDNLRTTSGNLATFTTNMQNGQGLLPRLMSDKAYADQSLAEFTLLVRQLNEAVSKVNTGNGTAGKLINDPAVYESINDILIGINESKMLRWLIRNRQQKGIEKRYDAGAQQPAPPPPPPPATNKSEAPPPDVPVTATTTTTAAATTSTQPPM
jgi:phospholipid/cholesterol/gamma-HCH transport system substrate-binding protein